MLNAKSLANNSGSATNFKSISSGVVDGSSGVAAGVLLTVTPTASQIAVLTVLGSNGSLDEIEIAGRTIFSQAIGILAPTSAGANYSFFGGKGEVVTVTRVTASGSGTLRYVWQILEEDA